MPAISRTVFIALAAALLVSSGRAGDAPKDSPFAQAGNASTAAAANDPLEFAGVSMVGKRTSINLYEKQTKRSFWVDVGATSSGVTVVKYDTVHDQVTIRRDGVEKTLPLRAPSAVVNGPATPLPPPVPITPAPALAAPAPTPATPTPTGSMSQARQEEEARMLVSDLLEIGIAQRHAYEEAQRKAAAGQTGQPIAQPVGQPATTPAGANQNGAAAASGQSTQPVTATTPSGG